MTASVAAPFADPNASVTTDVNLRAGPDTDFPAIVVIPSDEYVTIYACIEDLSWCDVSYADHRGWVAADYIRPFYQSRFMTVQEYAPLVALPSAPFDIKLYWTSFYRDQRFFGELDQWAAPRREPAFRTNSFYQPLASYGDWVDVNDEYVWVPQNVDQAWRPYTRGRWVNTDQYGWFWESDEPFGWATYHYGRWGFSHDVGWYWVPGTRWAPAWVAWRGSDDYVGWAPLPPASDSLNVSINIGTCAGLLLAGRAGEIFSRCQSLRVDLSGATTGNSDPCSSEPGRSAMSRSSTTWSSTTLSIFSMSSRGRGAK